MMVKTSQRAQEMKKKNFFQRSVCHYITKILSMSDELLTLKQAFRELDSQNLGEISREVFRSFIDQHQEDEDVAYSSATFDEIYSSIDLDGDGQIQNSEFLAAAISKKTLLSHESL